jgi:hypothetical protein
MKRSFSERKGFKEPLSVIQKDGMSGELRNSLWNVLHMVLWGSYGFVQKSQSGSAEIVSFSGSLWNEYFKKPIDSRPGDPRGILAQIRSYFFSCEWYEVYDTLEWILQWVSRHPKGRYEALPQRINAVLERELAGFRFVGGSFTDITDQQEIRLLEDELADDRFSGVQEHLRTALRLISNRENPDYRNSIKESISAVESLAKAVTEKEKASLSDALAELEKRGHLHAALKQAFVKFYAWTSDEGGIRHAMLEKPDLGAAEAKYMLLACTSFVNYLKAKL